MDAGRWFIKNAGWNLQYEIIFMSHNDLQQKQKFSNSIHNTYLIPIPDIISALKIERFASHIGGENKSLTLLKTLMFTTHSTSIALSHAKSVFIELLIVLNGLTSLRGVVRGVME